MSDLIEATAVPSLNATVDEADAADAARDWPRAAALWDELRAARPQEPHWWFQAGYAYSEAKMLDKAEGVLSEAVTRFPEHRWILHRHLVVARYAGDWREVLRRAQKLQNAAPDFWPGWLEWAEGLERLGNGRDADAVRRKTAERFAHEFWPNFVVAQIDAGNDPQAAIHIWSALLDRFPDQPAAVAALYAARDAAEQEPTKVMRAGSPREDAGASGPTGPLFDRPRHRRRRHSS